MTAGSRIPFFRFDSIRSRILAFAVLATLLPAGIALGFSYAQNRRALEEKITQDLLSQSAQAGRAMGVWLKERLYDLRVFAASEEVANNLGRAVPGAPSAGGGRLREYLVSLHERFGDYEQLMVLNTGGRVIAASVKDSLAVSLPEGWLETLRSDGQFVGAPRWDATARKAKLIVAVPVHRADGRIIGAFAAELNLEPVQALLQSFTRRNGGGAIYLMQSDGRPIASSDGMSEALLATPLEQGTLERLVNRENATVPYASFGTREVVGTLTRVPQADWAVVAELPADTAFEQVRRFRDVALLVITLLLLAAAASAYRFGQIIARPLDRLTQGAAEVAAGDLAVDLPEVGGGEVGSLTTVFNHMVSRLREGRRELDSINETLREKNAELERLSTTDGLTGLANHRSLMKRIAEEEDRSRRSKRGFAVLMADVDAFKDYNDKFGHPAGDEVLKKVAAIMRASTRTVDCVARYGGEEFAVVMPETSVAEATQAAERFRSRVAAEEFPGRRITLSIGVAEFPRDASDAQAIIAVADKALYRAKREGRDRVVQAGKGAKGAAKS